MQIKHYCPTLICLVLLCYSGNIVTVVLLQKVSSKILVFCDYLLFQHLVLVSLLSGVFTFLYHSTKRTPVCYVVYLCSCTTQQSVHQFAMWCIYVLMSLNKAYISLLCGVFMSLYHSTKRTSVCYVVYLCSYITQQSVHQFAMWCIYVLISLNKSYIKIKFSFAQALPGLFVYWYHSAGSYLDYYPPWHFVYTLLPERCDYPLWCTLYSHLWGMLNCGVCEKLIKDSLCSKLQHYYFFFFGDQCDWAWGAITLSSILSLVIM